MAPKFALFTKGSNFAPKQGFQKYIWVTIVLRSTLNILISWKIEFHFSWHVQACNYSLNETKNMFFFHVFGAFKGNL